MDPAEKPISLGVATRAIDESRELALGFLRPAAAVQCEGDLLHGSRLASQVVREEPRDAHHVIPRAGLPIGEHEVFQECAVVERLPNDRLLDAKDLIEPFSMRKPLCLKEPHPKEVAGPARGDRRGQGHR